MVFFDRKANNTDVFASVPLVQTYLGVCHGLGNIIATVIDIVEFVKVKKHLNRCASDFDNQTNKQIRQNIKVKVGDSDWKNFKEGNPSAELTQKLSMEELCFIYNYKKTKAVLSNMKLHAAYVGINMIRAVPILGTIYSVGTIIHTKVSPNSVKEHYPTRFATDRLL